MKINETPISHFHGLDHLRATAILLVLLFHYRSFFPHPEWFPDVIKFGWTGVDLFFVLSGFLITSQLFVEIKLTGSFSVKTFFTKRIFRILPIYYFVVGIYFLFPAFHEKEALPPLWKLLTFTQNIGFDAKTQGTFSHVWSLCIEEHFYLTLPLVLLLILKLKWKHDYLILPILFITQISLRAWIYGSWQAEAGSGYAWFERLYYPTYSRLDGLLIGVGIAAFYQFAHDRFLALSRYGNWLILAGFLVLTGVYQVAGGLVTYELSVFGFPFIAIGYGLMVIGAISPRSFLYQLQSTITHWLATLSYGIYLIHKGVIHLTQDLFAPFGVEQASGLMLVICLIMCVLVAFIFYFIVEKPFLRWRRIFLHKTEEQVIKVVASK